MMTDGAGSRRRTVRPSRRRSRVSRTADAVVLVIGESGAMSGEASSRTSLDLPGSPAGAGAGAGGHGEAGRGGAHERTSAESHSFGRRAPRRSSRPGSPGRRRDMPSPTCCSAASIPEESCPSRSRAPSVRRRSTTTTNPPDGRRIQKKNTRRSISTCRGRRSTRSVTA